MIRRLSLLAVVLTGFSAHAVADVDGEFRHHVAFVMHEVPGFEIGVELNHVDGIYREGQAIQAAVAVNQPCYVHVFNVSPNGQVKLLFPNEFQLDNRVSAESPAKIPEPTGRVRFVARQPVGVEQIVVLASLKPLNLKDETEAGKFRDFLRAVRDGSRDGTAGLRAFSLELAQQNGDAGWVGHAVQVVTRER